MQTTTAMRSDWASATWRSLAPSELEITTTATSPPGIEEQSAVAFSSRATEW